MGCDLISWRAAIGIHHSRGYHFSTKAQYKLNIIWLIRCLFSGMIELANTFKLGCIASFVQSNSPLQLSVIIFLLMLKSGDIESNPGPDTQHILSILHCNIRSIRNKMDYLKDNFLDFDILCFSETHLDHSIATENILLNSNFSNPYRKDRTNHGGGLLVYLNNSILHSRQTELEVYCPESIWFKVITKQESFLFGVFYSPKTADRVFFDSLNKNLEKAFEISDKVVILGDLNEDLLNPRFHNLKDILLTNSMCNVIQEPTRQQAILDPIILPIDMQFSNSGTIDLPDNISDHKATYLYLPFPYEMQSTFERTVWNFKKANFELLNESVLSTDWTLLNEGSINEACNYFTNTYIELLHKSIPSKKVRIRPNDKPWYDSEIRQVSRKRDRIRKTALKTGKATDWSKYKTLRNKVNNLKKHAKEQFYNTLETNLTNLELNDKKGFWKMIKYFVKNDDSSGIPPLTLQDNNNQIQVFVNEDEKSNCLNNYFASISKVDDSYTQLPPLNKRTENILTNVVISREEIEEIIKLLPTNKACGPDLISHRMLKGCNQTISMPLVTLFNRSLNEGIFPDPWKVANVTPIFKKGERSLPSNYRPVSLLSCVGKLFERVVFKYIYNFFLDNNLLYKYQSGFLPNHSTVYQLIDIYHHICQSFDAKQFSCMVFCDISKAFDRVWHKGLIFKLKENGIDGQMLNWISDYLSNRKQRVVLQTASSTLQSISAGVPQGSVLGPLFFLVYVNDITDALLSLTRLYADDSSLYCSASNMQDIEGLLNHDLHQISIWAKQWLVDFNPNKTEAILFTLNKDVANPELIFDNTVINFVENHKHLGLTLSSNGQWSTHINNILQSASKAINIMKKLKFTLTKTALNQIYLSYVRPILEYASIVWDGCTQQEVNSLEKLQNEAARIVTGLTRSVTLQNLYLECGWESLKSRREKQKYCFMYKVCNNTAPSYINDLIPPQIGDITYYELRNNSDLLSIRTRTSIFKNSCIPSSIDLWNNLEPNIKQNESLVAFKNSLSTKYNREKTRVSKHLTYSINRFASVMHARIRNNCSDLNFDLFSNHLRLDPTCSCDEGPENSTHFFFHCKHYENQRLRLFQETHTLHPLNIQKLLFGDASLSFDQNCIIFNSVQLFIIRSGRFK